MDYNCSKKDDFTQKYLIIHLLQSLQYSATREELQETNNKCNKLEWLMFGSVITILFKEKILTMIFSTSYTSNDK